MYWYKQLGKTTAYLLTVVLATACKPEIKKADDAFFDIKGYFEAEAGRLNTTSPAVLKTAVHNSVTQKHEVKITSWQTELALFTGSDINKPAWRNDYTESRKGTRLVYTANKPELKTRKIVVERQPGGHVKYIAINNRLKNLLYTSSEKLVYIPDSVYTIEKHQHVRVIGDNHYKISGLLH